MKTKRKSILHVLTLSAICLLASGCAPVATPQQDPQTKLNPVAPATSQEKDTFVKPNQLPVRFQKPAYMLKDTDNKHLLVDAGTMPSVPVGRDFSTASGPVLLRDIMKTLVALKGMNVSWANDVNQFISVDVDIRAGDDFFKSIDNILQQASYFYETQGNTIAIKNRETKTFYLPLPNVSSNYATSVGGDLLGSSSIGTNNGGMSGKLQITSDKNDFNFWKNIEENLDRILEITKEQKIEKKEEKSDLQKQSEWSTKQAGELKRKHDDNDRTVELNEQTSTSSIRDFKTGLGYYTIDKHLGLISVSASRPMLDKIGRYIDILKKELYRQVAIEAKIVEVVINDSERKGIDWSALLSTSVNLEMFGPNGIIYAQKALPQTIISSTGSDLKNTLTNGVLASTLTNTKTDTITSSTNSKPGRVVSNLALTGSPFAVLISALETQGKTNILSNPKISVLNGQPALISVGDTQKYIDTIESRVDAQTGAVTYSVKTATLMSGIGMSVIASIMENDEIVLSLTPITSKLAGDTIPYETIGLGKVGVPKIQLREMNTVVRVKSGELLMIGGLIDDVETDDVNKVPLLGDIPGLSRLFSHSTKLKQKRELVILLQPKLI
ncbi:MAG: pilus (MSHA type) biogenesis protein MshL [Deltaproteobacteria bacterium]|nr:pilus (MSHA type) biogenesis protein MshL [Deltaproteobacteria bacterium]